MLSKIFNHTCRLRTGEYNLNEVLETFRFYVPFDELRRPLRNKTTLKSMNRVDNDRTSEKDARSKTSKQVQHVPFRRGKKAANNVEAPESASPSKKSTKEKRHD